MRRAVAARGVLRFARCGTCIESTRRGKNGFTDRSLVVPTIERYFLAEGHEYKRGTIGLEHIIKDWGGPGPGAGTTSATYPTGSGGAWGASTRA